MFLCLFYRKEILFRAGFYFFSLSASLYKLKEDDGRWKIYVSNNNNNDLGILIPVAFTVFLM